MSTVVRADEQRVFDVIDEKERTAYTLSKMGTSDMVNDGHLGFQEAVAAIAALMVPVQSDASDELGGEATKLARWAASSGRTSSSRCG